MTGDKVWSEEAVLQILRNVGVDVECGACMCQAFTGSNGYEHTCGKETGIVFTAVEIVPCGAEVTPGDSYYVCELPKGHDGNHVARGVVAVCEWVNPDSED